MSAQTEDVDCSVHCNSFKNNRSSLDRIFLLSFTQLAISHLYPSGQSSSLLQPKVKSKTANNNDTTIMMVGNLAFIFIFLLLLLFLFVFVVCCLLLLEQFVLSLFVVWNNGKDISPPGRNGAKRVTLAYNTGFVSFCSLRIVVNLPGTILCFRRKKDPNRIPYQGIPVGNEKKIEP